MRMMKMKRVIGIILSLALALLLIPNMSLTVHAKENDSGVTAIPADGSVENGVTYYSSDGFTVESSSGCSYWNHSSYGKQDVYCFFDGYNSGDWKMGGSCNGTLTILFHYKEAISPDTYYIVSGRDGLPERNPASWKLYGSSDKNTWTQLSQESCNFGTTQLTPFSYPISTNIAYQYYKLEIVNSGDMELSEFYMSKGQKGDCLISSINDWNNFVEKVNGGETYAGKNVVLTADIGPVTKKINVGKTFNGTFDGGGHLLTVDFTYSSSERGAALFPYLTSGDITVKNLKLAGVIRGGIHAAGIFGEAHGNSSKITIDNVMVCTTIIGGSHLGGIVGHAGPGGNTCTVTNSQFLGTIKATTGSASFIGGIIGWGENTNWNISDCKFGGRYGATTYFNAVGYYYSKNKGITVNNIISVAGNVGSGDSNGRPLHSGNYTTYGDKLISRNVSEYEDIYDGEEHGINVSVTDPESDSIIFYGESDDYCLSDPIPTLTDVGEKTVYYHVFAKDYPSVFGSGNITIKKGDVEITAAPTPKELIYSGESQELVTAGTVKGGEIQYAIGMDATTIPNTGWDASIPKGIDVGTYYVWYKVIGDSNHEGYIASSPVTVTIAKVATVTYDANGATSGSAPTDSKSPYNISSTVTVLGNTGSLAMDGYTFDGWNTKEDGSGTAYAADATFNIVEDITLYAQWTLSPVATVTIGNSITEYNDFVKAVTEWNSAEDGATLTLLKDVETTGTISVSGNKVLDLNGCGIKANSSNNNKYSVITIKNSANLTIKDSRADEKKHYFSVSNNPPGLATDISDIDSGSQLSFTGGYITGGYGDATMGGGGVLISGAGTRLTLESGTIIGNQGVAGGGVKVDGTGSFVMNGGTISYNYATKAGAGVRLWQSTTVLTGGAITNNCEPDTASGSGVALGGGNNSASIGGAIIINDNKTGDKTDNYYLASGETVKISEKLTETADAGFYTASTPSGSTDVKIATGAEKDDILHIHSDNATNAGIVYCDGEKDWMYYNDKLYEITNSHHTHEAGTVWLTVTASIKAKTVTYNANGATGGSVPTDSKSPYNISSTVTVLGNTGSLTRIGYTFAGWNTKADGTGTAYAADATFNIVEDTTLYAQWSKDYLYLDAAWNAATKQVDYTEKYIGADKVTVVTAAAAKWNSGWYAVTENVTISGRVTVNGDVKLILCNGATLTATNGISVDSGKKFTVYGQTNDTSLMGALNSRTQSTTGVAAAGIGGSGKGKTSGVITINGGKVSASGSREAGGAGIGGGYTASGGTTVINGGVVTVPMRKSVAGIGGGRHGSGGNITINGGTVNAGGYAGAAIGGAYQGSAGNITINGGTVTATDGTRGAAIGSGERKDNKTNAGTIRINGGTVVAKNTAGSGSGGAGIGGGYGVPGGTIIITGGTVTATSICGAGIGGGPNANGGKVTISGGTVTAYSSGGGVGIGKGNGGKNHGTLTIANDHVSLAGNSDSTAGACFNYPSHRKKWVKIWEHIHSDITYGIEGNVLNATCTNDVENCNLVDGKLTLTLTAPNKLYDTKVYDKAKTAWTSVNHNEWEEFSILTGTTSKSGGSIEYYEGETKLDGAPTEEGTYIAKLPIVLNSKNEYLEQEFMIIKPEAIFVTVPQVNELTYNDTAQELVTAGVGRDGTIQYSLDDENWSSDIPVATNAGNYTVWVYVKGDELHNDSPKVSFDVTIQKKPAPVLTDEQKPTANNVVPEGDDQTPLINAPTEETPDGYKIVYAIGIDDKNVPDTGWSDEIPEGKDGTYYIWFKAVKDDNHEDTEPENIKVVRIDYSVTLSPATPTVGEPVTVTTTPKDASVVYEWYTGDDSGEFILIEGETGNTYTPTDADKGRTIKVAAKLNDKVIGEDIVVIPKAETVAEADKPIVVGEIYESNGTTPIVNAKITLKRGNTVVATTNTDADGKYSFSVEPGIYNVVSEYNGVTKTELVEITSSQDFDLTMPEKNTNSVLVVGDAMPDILVGGLDVEAETVRAAQNGAPETVTITMTVEKKEDSTEASENVNAIREQASDKTLEFFETKLVKVVDSTTDNAVTETDNVLVIVVPYDFTGKDNVTVYRSYGETTETLSDKTPGIDGTFQIDNEAKTITIYTKRLSTYAIGYNIADKESVETFNTDKEERKTAADDLLKDDDSEESRKLVENAKKDIDELPYDYDKALDRNEDALDDIITKLEKDLEKQRVLENLTDTNADVKIDQGEPVINVDTENIPEEYVEVVEEIAKKTTADIEDAVIRQTQDIVNKSEDVEDSNKNIVIIPSLEIDAKDYVISEDDTKLTLDIDAVYKSYETTDDITSAADTISAAASEDEADKEKVKEIGSGKIDTKGTPVNIRIELPEEFAQAIGATENSTNDSPETAYVKHSSNGINYEYNVKLYYDDDAYVAEFVDPNGFGTFTLSGTSESVVSVDGNNYTDLQSAIDDTEDGAVIKLINDNDVSASINTEKTITIDKDNHTGVVDIVVPPTLILTKTDNEDGTTTYKAVAKYTVTFDANGGTGTMAEQEIGGTAALNANTFTREGFVFDGWNTKTDGKGTAYADKADVTPTADMTLYAQWKENSKADDKNEDDKSKDEKKPDETKTDDKKTDEPKADDKKTDEPKIDETLEASKKNAEDKINNVVAEVNKIVDSLTNLSDEKKEEFKKQNDTTIADAKNAVDSSPYVEAVEAAYQKAIEATKATIKDALKTEVESQIVAAKKTIDNTKGLTDKQKKSLKTEVDKEAKKVIDSLDSTVEKIVGNAAKGTVSDAESTKENTTLVKKVMNKTAEIAKEAKSDAQVEVAANKYATPEKLRKNTLSINIKLKVDQVGNKINIEWGKVKDADGYQVFVQYCGKDFSRKATKTIKKNTTTKLSVKKINGKKLNLKKNYKILVRAYKKAGGKKLNIGKSITAHIVGLKNNNFTNVKDIKITNHTIINVGVGSTHKINAKTILVDNSKKQLSDAHAKEFRYASADPEIAKVNAKGEITGVKEGTTIIYVYARNGYAKEIKVTVVK